MGFFIVVYTLYVCVTNTRRVNEIGKACHCAGPLPVPEKWNEDLAKGAFDLEETDIGSSDQVREEMIGRKVCGLTWHTHAYTAYTAVSTTHSTAPAGSELLSSQHMWAEAC